MAAKIPKSLENSENLNFETLQKAKLYKFIWNRKSKKLMNFTNFGNRKFKIFLKEQAHNDNAVTET